MSLLFSPLAIKNITLKNRLVMSPMAQYAAENGFATNWHQIHYGTRATGGVGLIMVEATAVVPEGRITPLDLGIWNDQHINNLQQITQFAHSQDVKIGIQLAHSGRKGSYSAPWQGNHLLKAADGGWQTVAPSALPFEEKNEAPHTLSIPEINELVEAFAQAAQRAQQAGFDVIEIHAAHGYLLHEFLSPISNHRTDEYGGSLENRSRFLLQVVRRIRQVWTSEKPLFVRISATDWVENGWHIDEAVLLSKMLKENDVDLIDVSSGGLSPLQKIELKPGYQIHFSQQIKNQSNIPTGGVGLITTATQAEEILTHQQADLIFLGRELLRHPYFPLQAAKELNCHVEWPLQYARARL